MGRGGEGGYLEDSKGTRKRIPSDHPRTLGLPRLSMVLKQNFQAHLISEGYTEPKAEAKLIWLHIYSGFQIDFQVFSAIKWQYYSSLRMPK